MKYMTNNYWKQPTPTDIRYNENINEITRAVFYEFWSMVRREDGIVSFWHGNKFFTIELKRGQCIFKYTSWAKGMELDNRKVRKSLEILSKWYTELQIEARPFGLIITVKDYENLVKMQTETESKRKPNVNRTQIERNTSKENDKIEENEYTKESEQFLSKFNEIRGTNHKSVRGFLSNYSFWRETYTYDEIIKAVENAAHDDWFNKVLEPALLFRKSNKAGNVDYIGRLLNLSPLLVGSSPINRSDSRIIPANKNPWMYGPPGSATQSGGEEHE